MDREAWHLQFMELQRVGQDLATEQKQFYSLKSSHPLLPSLCPKVCSYVCISFAALQVGSSVLSFSIPHICVNILYLPFSF